MSSSHKIVEAAMSIEDTANGYYELSSSILQAMLGSTLRRNLFVVFVLDRPLLEACCRGLWICLVSDPSRQKMPSKLLKVAAQIDEVIQQRFDEWGAPFQNKPVANRYNTFLKSGVLKGLSDKGVIKVKTLILRLHSGVHGDLDSIEFYRAVSKHGKLLQSAKQLCVIGYDPLLMYLRFAISKRFPHGPINTSNLLAEPLMRDVLRVMNMDE